LELVADAFLDGTTRAATISTGRGQSASLPCICVAVTRRNAQFAESGVGQAGLGPCSFSQLFAETNRAPKPGVSQYFSFLLHKHRAPESFLRHVRNHSHRNGELVKFRIAESCRHAMSEDAKRAVRLGVQEICNVRWLNRIPRKPRSVSPATLSVSQEIGYRSGLIYKTAVSQSRWQSNLRPS
jgi:hypothetical protein